MPREFGRGDAGDFINCANISSDSELWSITLCSRVPSSAPGQLLQTTLRLLHNCDSGYRHVSIDADTEARVFRFLGPHEFFFLLEGVETLWAPQLYLGNCTYRFSARLELPAPKYRLFLTQLRTNFSAFNELEEVFPEFSVLTIANGTFFELPAPLQFWNETGLPVLPNCSSGWIGGGRFVLLANNDARLFQSPVEYNKACFLGAFPTASFFVNVSSDALVHWRPYTCLLQRTTPRDFHERLIGLRIDFVGDSHMRILYHHVLWKFVESRMQHIRALGSPSANRLGI